MIESCLNFIDILEVNDWNQISFIDNFERMRKCLTDFYRERDLVSTISLLRILTQVILIIENFHSANKDNKNDSTAHSEHSIDLGQHVLRWNHVLNIFFLWFRLTDLKGA